MQPSFPRGRRRVVPGHRLLQGGRDGAFDTCLHMGPIPPVYFRENQGRRERRNGGEQVQNLEFDSIRVEDRTDGSPPSPFPFFPQTRIDSPVESLNIYSQTFAPLVQLYYVLEIPHLQAIGAGEAGYGAYFLGYHCGGTSALEGTRTGSNQVGFSK